MTTVIQSGMAIFVANTHIVHQIRIGELVLLVDKVDVVNFFRYYKLHNERVHTILQ